jgi:hypothetical protein
MPYGDSFDVTSSDPLPTSNCLLTEVDVLLEVRPLNMLFDWFHGQYFHATLGLERINHVGESVSHIIDLTSL